MTLIASLASLRQPSPRRASVGLQLSANPTTNTLAAATLGLLAGGVGVAAYYGVRNSKLEKYLTAQEKYFFNAHMQHDGFDDSFNQEETRVNRAMAYAYEDVLYAIQNGFPESPR